MSKAVFITGASSGIGRALALELARRGYDLFLTARRVDALEGLRTEINAGQPERRVHVRQLDVRDDAACDAIVEVARAAGHGALTRLWLCHPRLDTLVSWRTRSADVRLVNSTRLQHLPRGPERRAAELAASGVDAINLHHSDWSGGLTTLFHRFERLTFGWDAQHERVLRGLLRMGIDGVYSDWVDRMVDALRTRDQP